MTTFTHYKIRLRILFQEDIPEFLDELWGMVKKFFGWVWDYLREALVGSFKW